jgi:hypothetical protein
MKRQIITTIAIGMFITAIAVASARAQNAGTLMVTVPFEFSVSGKTLPAGNYLVRKEDSRTSLRIQNRDGSSTAFVLVSPINGRDIQNESKLVFNRYGNQYFLAQVWVAGSSRGEEPRKSAAERSIRRELAALKQRAETVTIAARSN